jgi:uncharacterized protein
MQYSDKYIDQLKRRISELNPHLILLFGSHASGTSDEDSDIDLLVVTKDEFIPENFNERIDLQLKVSEHIFDIAKKVPLDLLVYTLPMYRKFLEQNNEFAKDVRTKGKILYEGTSRTMA